VYVVVFGLFDGCLAVMFGMGTLYIVGEKLVGRAFGNLCFAAAIGNVLGPPVAGLIFDVFGKYDIAFYLSGAVMTCGVCLLFLVPWLMPTKTELCQEKVMLLNETDKLTKKSTNYERASRTIYSFPTEAAFFARAAHCDHVLQRSVSMEMLNRSGTSTLMKSAMFRAWSAAAQLHCTDSLNESSGYESDSNRQSPSSQSSEIVDTSEENKLSSVTIVTPALSFDDLEVVVQQEKLVKGGWYTSSMDMFSVMFENSLEHDVTSRPASIIDNTSSGKDITTDGKIQITTLLSQAELDYNLELCQETIL